MAENERGIRRFVRLILDRASAKKVADDMSETLAKAGEDGGKAFLREIRAEFDKKMAGLRHSLSRGLIDEATFRREAENAARIYNTKLSRAIEELRAKGKLTDSEFARLGRRFMRTGDEGERAFGRVRAALSGVTGLLAGFFGIHQGWRFFSDASRAADEVEKSFLTLESTAKLTGVSLAFLLEQSAEVRSAFGLDIAAANELTIQLARLAGRAGDLAATGPGMAAFLDIGAARGLTAAETLQAVRQAILGIDEGTDKLFGVNPSVLYAEFAASIGKTASSLTDAEKGQAILNAAMQDGEVVRGAYAAWLETAAGKQYQLNVQVEESQATLGRAIQPLRMFVTDIAGSVVEGWQRIVEWIQVGGSSLAVFVGRAEVWKQKSHLLFKGFIADMVEVLADFVDLIAKIPPGVRGMLGMGGVDEAAAGMHAWAARLRANGETAVRDAEAYLARIQEAHERTVASIGRAWSGAGAVGPGFVAPTRTPTPVGGETLSSPTASPSPFEGFSIGIFGEDPGKKVRRVAGEVEAGANRMQDALMSAADNASGAFERLFVASMDGFDSMGEAAAGVGASVVSGMIQGMAAYHNAQGIGKLAEGTWPPNPAAIKSALGHFAAAGAFRAVAASVDSVGSGGGRGAAGLGSGAFDPSGRMGADLQQRAPITNIYIDPIDPNNPVHQRQVGRLVSNAAERGHVTVHVGRR